MKPDLKKPKEAKKDKNYRSDSFYETTITCGNCKNELDVSIPTGMSVKEFRKLHTCSICKCNLK